MSLTPFATESFFGSFFLMLKNELVHGEAFATRDAAKMAIVSYMGVLQLLHETLGYRTPMAVDDEAMSV